MENINEHVSKNITLLRKENKWTQQDLADKLNYSDKTISKWERGESTPDIEMLCKVAEIFNVDLDYLVTEHTENDIKKHQNDSQIRIRNILILIMMCVAVYLIAAIIFVYATLRDPNNAKRFWVTFLMAVPICALISNLYARRMHKWLMRLISVSIFVWTIIASVYCGSLTLGQNNFWLLFLIGIPIQAAICLFFFWRKTF